MPEPRRRGRAGALASGLMVAAAAMLAASTTEVRAAEVDWAGSKVDAPTLSDFSDGGRRGKATLTTEQFEIRGTFWRERGGNPATPYTVQNVRVAFDRVREEGDTTPRDPGDPCLPADLPAAEGQTSTVGGQSKRTFRVPKERSTWPCNGRFTATATATANNGPNTDSHTLVAELTVAVRPVPVTTVDVEVDDEPDEVTITFEKLAAGDLAPDALPYRVQRAGPADADGDFGLFVTIGDPVPLDGETSRVDIVDEPGDYRYRVLSVRSGADGPVFASGPDTAVAEATIEPDPAAPTTTTTTEPGSTTTTTDPGPRLGSARPLPTLPNRPAPLPAPPTTVDPGFENELDYDGAAPLPREQDDSPELAGEEGLSVIQTEDEGGAGLVAPVAGGLVLLAWAGHGVYLNRLAKQF